MACRRVIKVGERVVKEFISQFPCHDLPRMSLNFAAPQIPTKNKVHQTKSEMTAQTRPRVIQHLKNHNGVHAMDWDSALSTCPLLWNTSNSNPIHRSNTCVPSVLQYI